MLSQPGVPKQMSSAHDHVNFGGVASEFPQDVLHLTETGCLLPKVPVHLDPGIVQSSVVNRLARDIVVFIHINPHGNFPLLCSMGGDGIKNLREHLWTSARGRKNGNPSAYVRRRCHQKFPLSRSEGALTLPDS